MADGTRALAAGLRAGGVDLVCAFPGSPATVLAQLFEAEEGVDFRWSANEATALAHAFGAAMAGRGTAVMMKHVGVNVALDALQVMGVVHTLPAPLILVEGADARPGSSQSAQDGRPLLAGTPNLLILGPTTPHECAVMAQRAAEISSATGMVVVLRGDARMFKSVGDFAPDEPTPVRSPFGAWPERSWALSTTARTHGHHLDARAEVMRRLQPWVEDLNESWGPESGEVAVIVSAHLGASVSERVRERGLPGLRLLTENPLPVGRIAALCEGFDKVVVLEECLPWLERDIRAIAQEADARVRVLGRAALGDARPIGWLDGEALTACLDRLGAPVDERLPIGREPVLAAPEGLEGLSGWLQDAYDTFEREHPLSGFPDSDPRKEILDHLRSLGSPAFIASDPGITGVLALAEKRSDVKMHMGCAVPIAAGWSRAREGLAIAVVGDTNLPHSEWSGLVEVASCDDDVLSVVVDNGYSEMTQRIVTARPSSEKAIASFAALGIETFTTSTREDWRATLTKAAQTRGPRLVWFYLP